MVAVGGFLFNSIGPTSGVFTNAGQTSVQDSHIASIENLFVDCAAKSTNEDPISISFGASSAFGGAFVILHAPQITSLDDGLLLLPGAIDLDGFNFTVVVSKFIFFSMFSYFHVEDGPFSAS